MNTSSELKTHFDKVQDRLEGVCLEFPWTDKNAYISWLVQTYAYALNSTRILAMTGGRMPTNKTRHSNRFIAHASEERGHEKLLENDVKKFGLDIKKIPPSSEAQAFHQSLYYWITEGNPLGIYGWVLTLEGFAVRNVPRVFNTCLEKFGSEVTSFLKVHAGEDPDHLEKAFNSLSDLTPEEYALVGRTLTLYADLYANVLEKIKSEVMGKSKIFAA